MQAEGRQFAQSGRDSAMRGGDLAFSYSRGYRLEWWRREAAVRWATVMLALVVLLVAAPTWADFRAEVEAYDRGDYATAMKEWRPLAELGNAPAQVALGWMYTEGKGVPPDDKEAARWYQLAANWGSASAQFVLGVMYAEGRGVPQDGTLAVRWVRRAAAQGLAEAQYNLGVRYAAGHVLPQDNNKAVRWYRRAAAQGDAEAQHNLGLMYAKGRGVLQDDVQAHMWVNLAAARGNEHARKARDLLAGKMTLAQIAEAQRLAREWQPQVMLARP